MRSAANLLPLLLLLPACGEGTESQDPAPVPAPVRPDPGERLLEVDGLVVTFGELEPFLAYFDTLYPQVSYTTKVGWVLDQHWLPVRLARRGFAERRAELREQAKNLSEVADNVYDLQARGTALGGQRSEQPVVRQEVELSTAVWLFDPARVGQVSGPIEVPQGFKVVAAHDLIQSSLALDDRVDAYQVPFFVSDMRAFMDWLGAEKTRVANRVTYVHPDFTDVLPPWLKAP